MLTPDTRRRLGCALAGAPSAAVVRFLLTDYCEAARRLAQAQALPAGLFVLPLRGIEDLAARHGLAAALHVHDALPDDPCAVGLVAELASVLGIALRRLHDLQHRSGIERTNGECTA